MFASLLNLSNKPHAYMLCSSVPHFPRLPQPGHFSAMEETIPQPNSRLKQDEYLRAVYGEEQDPDLPPHEDRWANLQRKTRSSYKYFIRSNPSLANSEWMDLTISQREELRNLLNRLFEDNPVESDILRRAPWLPAHLFKTYITQHRNYRRKKKGQKAEDEYGEVLQSTHERDNGDEQEEHEREEPNKDDEEDQGKDKVPRLPSISSLLADFQP
ncbi:hypothetical protein ABW19_dt0202866 [Dactylella cylindrospora]|nr:hypothetical protein ABW19_dt0202866 [Dactylella cylindrospora]